MLHPLRSLLLPLVVSAAAAPVVRAQSANPAIWCPPGATWVYGYGLFNVRGTITVSYARDTVMAGRPAQLLTRLMNSVSYIGPNAYVPNPPYYLPNVVTRAVGDRVEVFAHGRFYTLYDFGAPEGSSWLTPLVIPAGPCPQAQGIGRVTVDSVGSQLIGGRVLRWFRPRLDAPPGASYQGYWPGRIYEQVGSIHYLQPQSPACPYTDPGVMGPFQAYRAPGQPTIGTNRSGALVLAAARVQAAGFMASPNPGTGGLTLQLPVNLHPAARLRLLDLSGRTLRDEAAARQLDLSGVPAGVYTLRLEQPGQAPLVRKVVRQ